MTKALWGFLFVLLLAGASLAQTAIPGAKHPVAQLVEWEILANPVIQRDSLQRMAAEILDRLSDEEIPLEIREKLDRKSIGGFFGKLFRRSTVEIRRGLLKNLPLEDLQALATLAAPIEYFEIPKSRFDQLTKLQVHQMNEGGVSRASNLVNFSKNGELHVRWFIHPLANSKYLPIVKVYEQTFQERLVPVRGTEQFHFTSSRSLIVFNGSYDNAISLKLSLPAALGPFQNKTIHTKEYTAWTRHNQYLRDRLGGSELPHMKLLMEPYGIGWKIPNTDYEDAFLFRGLGELTGKNGRYYLPAFSAFDATIGREIARRNGSHDPLAFWESALLKPLAFAMAELRASTGAEHTSAHSQNILIEMDQNMRPTGKIVLRDFDFYIDDFVFEKMNRLVPSSEGLTKPGPQKARFLLAHGLPHLPDWMSNADLTNWAHRYFDYYAEGFKSHTGLSTEHSFRKQVSVYENNKWIPTEQSRQEASTELRAYRIEFNEKAYRAAYEPWLETTRSDHSKTIRCEALFHLAN